MLALKTGLNSLTGEARLSPSSASSSDDVIRVVTVFCVVIELLC